MSTKDNPIDKFLFSVKAGEEQRKDLELKVAALEERIDTIGRKVEVGGLPLLPNILAISHEQKELEMLGKALLRVAELIPQLDELKRRKNIVDLALQDPGWLAATFGDFDQEIDSLIIDNLK